MSVEQIKRDMRSLEEDLAKVTHDFSSLGTDFGKGLKAETKELAKDTLKKIENELSSLREKIDRITDQHKDTINKIDATIRREPYWFIVAALIVGLLLGKSVRRE